ncbi:hypothetical protein [Antarctobacter sp.]|uniref:hypothetical protein n=1 Tax=Antarctobacter sp. TaxID=1872577 RepID=UPI003A92D9DC
MTVPLPPSKEFLAFPGATAAKAGVSGHDFSFFNAETIAETAARRAAVSVMVTVT